LADPTRQYTHTPDELEDATLTYCWQSRTYQCRIRVHFQRLKWGGGVVALGLHNYVGHFESYVLNDIVILSAKGRMHAAAKGKKKFCEHL